MAWRDKFNLGITHFQAGRLEQAVSYFTDAFTEEGGSTQFIIYDSRGAVYEQLKRIKEALLDAKTTIKLAPDQWHGYARSARLFSHVGKFDASLQMADLALARMKPQHAKRRAEVEKLKEQVTEQKAVATTTKQLGKANVKGSKAAPLSPESKRALRMRQEYIAALPVELFGEVFREVMEVDSTSLITLLRVCHSWRSIVEGTPHLWDTLILTQRSPQRKLRRWLKHSGGRIHDLQIRPGASSHLDWPFEELKYVRWKSLRTLKSNEWNIFTERKSNLRASITNLQELILGREVVDGMQFDPVGESMYPILASCPFFQSLTLRNMIFNWELAATNLTTLTFLHLNRCRFDSPDSVLPALAANPRLQTLIIDSWPFPLWANLSNPKIPKIALEELKTVKLVGNMTGKLLECLKTPALADLELHSCAGLGDTLDHLASQHPQLERFSINQCPWSTNPIIDFLSTTPSLKYLELVNLSGTANGVVEALATPTKTADNRSKFLCPSLTYANLSNNRDVKTGPVVRLIRTRLPPATDADAQPVDEQSTTLPETITTLKIDGCEQIDVGWVKWLRENVAVVSCVYQTRKKAGWKR